jgi:hypothetical protein
MYITKIYDNYLLSVKLKRGPVVSLIGKAEGRKQNRLLLSDELICDGIDFQKLGCLFNDEMSMNSVDK